MWIRRHLRQEALAKPASRSPDVRDADGARRHPPRTPPALLSPLLASHVPKAEPPSPAPNPPDHPGGASQPEVRPLLTPEWTAGGASGARPGARPSTAWPRLPPKPLWHPAVTRGPSCRPERCLPRAQTCSPHAPSLQEDPAPGLLGEVSPALCSPRPAQAPTAAGVSASVRGTSSSVTQKPSCPSLRPHTGSWLSRRGVGCTACSARMCLTPAAAGPRLRLESRGETSAR